VKNLSSKRAKALSIPKKVKDTVWERDGHRCICCDGTYLAYPEAHFIPRQHSGLGIEENVLTLCRPCHDQFDKGPKEKRDELRERARAYLMKKYPGWSEAKLIYKRR